MREGLTQKSFGPRSNFFYPTNVVILRDTILSENDTLITDQAQICEIFKNYFDYFVNVAKDIDDSSVEVHENHRSVKKMHKYMYDIHHVRF